MHKAITKIIKWHKDNPLIVEMRQNISTASQQLALGWAVLGVREVFIILKYVKPVHLRAQQGAEGGLCLPWGWHFYSRKWRSPSSRRARECFSFQMRACKSTRPSKPGQCLTGTHSASSHVLWKTIQSLKGPQTRSFCTFLGFYVIQRPKATEAN